MGLYRRKGSRFWWMSYTYKGEQLFQSTKCTSKDLAKKILSRREGEIALEMFKIVRQGERMSFAELCREFESAHVPTLARSTQTNVRAFLETMREFFGERSIADIDAKLVTDYRNYRKSQPSKNDPTRRVKGATVNREMSYLRCMFNFAIQRKYLSENPTKGVKQLDERRDRPAKRMVTVEEEQRILEYAPAYLRIAIVLLAQSGVRTYSEGLSLRWDQVDFDRNLILLGGETKSEGSSEPVPLTGIAREVLLRWKKEQAGTSPFVFPSPVKPNRPIRSVKTAWTTTLRNAKVAHFPIYHLRHVFCTRLSGVAADAVVQRAMRHLSPETKRRYQLGMTEQIRQGVEAANERIYGKGKVLHFYDSEPAAKKGEEIAVSK